MPPQTLEYQPIRIRPTRAPHEAFANRRSVSLALFVAAVVVAINTLMVATAVQDESFNALRVMAMPIINCVLCNVSLAFSPLVGRYTGGPLALHRFVSILPLAAILIDGLAVMSMDHRGC